MPTHAERSRQMLGVLAKHGIAAAGARVAHGGDDDATQAVQARAACEELGTTFIKLGQMLSMRADLLPDDYRSELAKLQDDVAPVDVEAIEARFESEFGLPPQAAFARWDREPLGSASIGQVHAAQLFDGREVVVKVRKPGVRELVEYDVDTLKSLTGWAEKFFPSLDDYDLEDLLEQFDDTLRAELDYTREARNIAAFRKLFGGKAGFSLPEVVDDYSTSRILTQTRLDGERGDEMLALSGRHRTIAAGRLARFVLEPALTRGIFHADLHAGNVFFPPNGSIAVVDFGMVGHLTDALRRGIGDMLLAIQHNDAPRLLDKLVQIAPPRRPIDRTRIEHRLTHLLERYVAEEQRLDIGVALREIMELVRVHQLHAPGSLALFFKAVVCADSLILTLTPDRPLAHYLDPIAKRVARAQLSPADWAERARVSAQDAVELSVDLPRRADRVLTSIEAGNLRVWARIDGADTMIRQLERMVERANAAMIAAACIVGVTVLFSTFHPSGWERYLGWIFGVVIGIAGLVLLRTFLGTLATHRNQD
ncbi:MAG: AarF/ABC1/UbiB kinase family protein [Candidatus Eremiobacteraeota bacterium]|nr:AarF/ABC1/UbiB kinase family protein [Candidatus Eremiobacteraeota bacterium]